MTRDRKLVVSHMKHDGKHRGVLSPEEDKEVYMLGDGMGRGTIFQDWSHVRDSSEEAITQMAERIREIRESKGLGEADLSEPVFGPDA